MKLLLEVEKGVKRIPDKTSSFKWIVLHWIFACSIYLFVMEVVYPYYKACAQFLKTRVAKSR